MLFQPDLGYWLEAVAAVVALKGGIEIALLWRVFRQPQQSHALQSPSTPLPGGRGALPPGRPAAVGQP
jgi:hypothetical protein